MSVARPRLLLMGAYGQDNLGDEAILEVHLQQLKDFDVTVVTSDPAQTSARYGVPAVQTYGGERGRTLRAFLKSDVVIYGGGSLVKELPAPYFRYRLVANLTAATLAARLTGKGAVFSAMGVERLPSRMGRFLARRAANGSHLFLVRDVGSGRKLAAVGSHATPTVVADPAYLLRADDAANARAEALRAGLGAPELVVLNPMSSAEVPQARERTAKAFAALADHIHQTSAAHVLVLPFKTRGVDNDVDIARDVIARTLDAGRISMAPLDLRPSDVVAVLARASAFVGMRHHGVLLSLVARAPTLAVPYAEKTENLVEEFGLSEHSVRAGEIDDADLIALFASVLENASALRASSEATLRTMEARALSNFEHIATFVRARRPR